MQDYKGKKKTAMALVSQKYLSILKAKFPGVFPKSFIVETKVLVRAGCQGNCAEWNGFLVNSYIFGFSSILIIWKLI